MWRDAGENKKSMGMKDYFGKVPEHDVDVFAAEDLPEDFWPQLGDTIDEDDYAFEIPLDDDDDFDAPIPDTEEPPEPIRAASASPSNKWIEPRVDRQKLLTSIREGDEKIIRRGVRIEACAVWDTVGALGPIATRFGLFRPKQDRKLGFIRSDLNQGINNAFQALSLHDRRRSFLPMVWSKPTRGRDGSEMDAANRLEQCWFMGYHGDIGGGRHGEGLAHFSLAWMLARLRRFVDMDAANFWSPRLILSNWQVVNDAGKRGMNYALRWNKSH